VEQDELYLAWPRLSDQNRSQGVAPSHFVTYTVGFLNALATGNTCDSGFMCCQGTDILIDFQTLAWQQLLPGESLCRIVTRSQPTRLYALRSCRSYPGQILLPS